jgi:HlyD family secretion protein
MDRAIDPAVLSTRRRRRLALVAGACALVLLAFTYGPGLLRPGVARTRLRIETVDRGPVEATLSANGTVMPELEELVASPVDARVTRIFKRAGDPLATGDAILELDLSEPRLTCERLARAVAIKRNQQLRARLDSRSQLADLDAATEAKRLEVQALRARLAQQAELAQLGLVSSDAHREAQLNEAKAALELERLIGARAIAQEAARVQIDGLELELATLDAERREARRVLELGATRAVRPSVVTWAVTETGALVRRGEPLARLSDLASFRIEATTSASHARLLHAGLDALVRLGALDLRGQVSGVEPTVRDGVLHFWIRLAQPSHPALRPSLKADVSVVTERRTQAVRIARGPFLTGRAAQDVFLVRAGRAIRTPIALGLIGQDTVEIQSGAQPGDALIVSDMTSYLHARELTLQ